MSARRLIVMGASAGALGALSEILPALPADFAWPIVVVVHLPPDKQSVMAELLQVRCAMAVQEAGDKEPILPGVVYIAPPDYHVLVEANEHLSLSVEAPVLYSRPSIDVLFETAADAYGPDVLGIVLTGANQDGAAGLQAIIRAGGTGLVQQPDKAYASMMPQAAIDACPTATVLSLHGIADYLKEMQTA